MLLLNINFSQDAHSTSQLTPLPRRYALFSNDSWAPPQVPIMAPDIRADIHRWIVSQEISVIYENYFILFEPLRQNFSKWPKYTFFRLIWAIHNVVSVCAIKILFVWKIIYPWSWHHMRLTILRSGSEWVAGGGPDTGNRILLKICGKYLGLFWEK